MQAEGREAASSAEYDPGAQPTHADMVVAPIAAEYIPAAQAMHALDDAAPVDPKYLPAAQKMQLNSPLSGLYLPAAHGSQAVAATSPDRPAAQLEQKPAASNDEYMPAGQFIQVLDPATL